MRGVLHRLRRTLARPAAVFVYHAGYARTVAGVPIDPARADEILAFLLDRGLIRRRDVSPPIPASLENLLRVHTPAYLESIQDPATLTGIFGSPVRPEDVQQIIDLQRLSVGGTIQATRLALGRPGGSPPIAVNLKGGLHHAAPNRGMGFCVFNDVAVAIRRLRARGFHEPVLVIDLDVHDGNGTRAVFSEDATVYTFSIHNHAWDDAPAVAATSIALGEGVRDDTYLAAVRDALPPVLAAHRPGLVVYIAGCDPAVDDRLGDWRITSAGLLERDRFVVEQVRGDGRRRRTPLVILPGGGYGPSAWRYSARFFAWLISGRVEEPPDDLELALTRFRPIARQFAEHSATHSSVDQSEWTLTEAELAEIAHGAAGQSRVLGHYSSHGLELLLERLGFFKQLRDRGFRHPVLDVTFGHAMVGETIRVYGDVERRDLVMELRVKRDRRVVPGMDVLYVEWLLLQNPRIAFGGRLAPLPGQEHPGLGMLGEVAAWLLVVCETLGLDGVAFEPAHYYTAALGQHRLRFLEPEDQARFEALREAVAGMSLADADRAIAQGRLVDAETGEPAPWRPALMVVPVSGRLKALIGGPSYERALEAARNRLRLVTA
ncbi:MAG TPA: histone deacetylase [Gemmatimonadales bacterium]|nr:histone deacetylase [Gemmatimonadales bacterium]